MRLPLRETSICEKDCAETDCSVRSENLPPDWCRRPELSWPLRTASCLQSRYSLPAGTDVEFDRRTVGHRRQRMILDPTTLLHDGLSRRNGEQIQFRLCTFTLMFGYESHYYENTSRIFLFFLYVFTRRTPDPDWNFRPRTVRFIPAGMRLLADSFNDLLSRTSSATSMPVFTAFVMLQLNQLIS